MTPALERLAEIVRQAEAKSRAKKLGAEMQRAASHFREAEQRARLASERLRDARPARLRALEQADLDEQTLKDLTRKLAQFKASLESDQDAEQLIVAAQVEIDRKRKESRAELDEIAREADEARRELRAAIDQYQQLRRELDRLQPELAAGFGAEDRLLWEAEMHFPGGHLQALAREVEASTNYFGGLGKLEQYAQLKIWIGRFRQYQASEEPEQLEDLQVLAQRVFHQLKTLSKQHEPGYIEAFRHDYTTDWAAYVVEAQEQLIQATEAARRARGAEQQRQEQQAREQERAQQARESGQSALEEIRALVARGRLPDEGLDELLALTRGAVGRLGASNPALIELVMPYRERIDGPSGDPLRALRRNLDRARQDEGKDEATIRAQFEDLAPATRGLRALMIGGSVREDARRALESIFEFGRLEWEPYEGSKPAALDSLEQRVRHRGVDLILILKSFIGHHVTDRLRPLCEQQGIPCLMVEHGYGPAQVGETMRRGLLRTP